MLDLTSLKNVLKRESAAKGDAAISAVVVDGRTDEHQEKVKAILTTNGFAVDKATKNEDGTVVYAQTTDAAVEGQIIRVSPEMLVVIKGFDAQAMSENAVFSPETTANGFFPGVDAAVAGIASQLQAALVSKADVSEKLNQFGVYVLGLSSLPAQVFKADAELQALIPVETVAKGDVLSIEALLKAAPLGSDGTAWSAMSTVDKISWLLQSFTKKAEKEPDGDECPAGADPVAWGAMTPDEKAAAKVKASAPAAKADTPDLTAAITAAVTAAMAPLATSVQALTSKVEGQQSAIADIAKKSDQALTAVKTTVVAAAASGDPMPNGIPIKKSEDTDPRTGCFDTAFISRAAKRDGQARK